MTLQTRKHFGQILILISTLVTSYLGSSQAWADEPQEQVSQQLERTMQTGNTLQGQLIKNRYRQEPYDANYTVQVPYQDTETYYEDVPYETTEDYYESVPYQDTEEYIDHEQKCESQYQCRNVPDRDCSYQNVCRTVPDQNCHQERVCRPVPGEQRCEEAEECGTNARGERICKTRKVCHDGPSREDCDYVQRCENTSRQECSQEKHCVETTRQECGYENVCYSVPVTRTRTVTRYRQEQRTRTVTKYYQVEKTREVTRYRDETRCCVTKYRDVFDHQDTLNVTIQFPQDAILYDGETEKMVISWIEKDNQIDVGLKMLTTFTSYKVVDRSVQGADAVLKLETVPVPALDPRLVGDQTVTGLRLKIMEDNTGVVVFKDVGQLAKISTVYELVVKDNTGLVLTTQRVTANGIADQKITLNQKLSLERDHTLTLKVLRSGAGLRPPIAFLKTFFRPH